MAITQVGTTVEQGITYGFSKWCNQLFADGDWKPSELAKYSWCRWKDKYIGCCSATSTNIQSQQGAAVTQMLSYFNSSLSETSNNYVTHYNDDRIPTNEPYCFNILMYGRRGDQTLTSDCASNYRVITSCSDFQSLYVLVDKYQPAQSTISVNYPTARTVNCNNLQWANGGVYNTNNDAHAQWITVWTVFVIDEDNFFVTRGMAFPGNTPCMYDGVMGAAQYNLRPSNDLSISYGNRITESKWRYYYGDITNYQKTKHLLRWYKNGITGIEPQTWGDSKTGVYDVDDDVAIIMRSENAVYGNINIRYTYYLKSEEAVKNAIAYTGLRWKYQNGDTTHVYTPIIDDDGFITGYSTNPDAVTKLNDITDVTGNNISPLPPTPTPPSPTPGIWDDMPGAGSSIGALAGARCYICSKTDITNLKTWMSKTEADGGPPDGYDVLSSLISVMAFPIDMTPASSGPATPISFTGLKTSTDNQLANIAAALLSIANQVGATPITEIKTFTSTATAFPSAGNPFTIDLGTCDCPTFYSSDFPFVDYDASVELYIPFIGTMSLDTQTVMGKSLHAYMSVDPITGAIYAWCECTKDGSRVVVASGSGAFGVNTPITANQVGMAMAQIKNNAAQQRQTAIQSALTLGVGAFAGMDKNISSILSRNMTQAIGQRSANIAIATGRDYMDALSVGASQAAMTAIPNAIGANLNTGRANRQIAQANHNSITGSAGGSTADWSCSYTPYLKVITPDVHRAGEQYEHTYGIPTIQSGTLSSFSGLTFCANPDVSSISTATDQEKQQIFGLLSGGVYV